MKIAFVSLMGGAPWGGSEALWHSLAKFALDRGDDILVSVYDWGMPHEKITQLKQIGAIIRYRKRFNADAGIAEKIQRFIQKRKPAFNKDYQSIIDFKPDYVFISQGDSFDIAIHHLPLYELIVKHNIAYGFVCHSHAQYSFIPPKDIYPGAIEIFNKANQVYFVSQRQWKLTERRLAMKITNGLFTWNPLNITMPNFPLAWPKCEFLQMAIVGNLSDSKGHDTIFEVLSTESWKERNWTLNIYGKGGGKNYLEKLALFYGIEHKINFHGHVADMIKVWEINHLLLIPSAGEGLPISLVEAMACGRMAVVTDVGGNTELIKEGQNGFIATSPATHAYADAMNRVWLGKRTWQQLGVNAFNDINTVLDRNPEVKIYNEILKLQLQSQDHI